MCSIILNKGIKTSETMQEIDPNQLEQLVAETQDPDMLKELMSLAVHANRDDLVEVILERSIRTHYLVEKLQDFSLAPLQIQFVTRKEDVVQSETPDAPDSEEPPIDPYA